MNNSNTENKQSGRENNNVMNPDKSADPPQPQGKNNNQQSNKNNKSNIR